MISNNEAVAKISEYISSNEDELVKFLTDFIAIKSVTYGEEEAVQFLKGKMEEFGYDEIRVDSVGNVLGRVGSGKTVLLYDAHIDTVDLGDLDEWGFNPLEAQIRDGVIHGRGAVDDKGPLAAATFAGKALKALGLDEDFTLWISGSVAEEDVEGSAVQAMMEVNDDIKPDFVLIAECSDNQIVRGHKGRALIRITVPGKCAHGSTAYMGDNALIKALPIMDSIDKLKLTQEDPDLGGGTIEVTDIKCFAPSLNTIPGKCVITCDRRISCSESIEDIVAQINPFVKDIPGVIVEIDTEYVKSYTGHDITCVDYFPSWVLPEANSYIQSGISTFKNLFEKDPEITVWPCCTNGTHLAGRMGIPSMGFGPGLLEDCHSTNDQVKIADLLDSARFYATLPLFVNQE